MIDMVTRGLVGNKEGRSAFSLVAVTQAPGLTVRRRAEQDGVQMEGCLEVWDSLYSHFGGIWGRGLGEFAGMEGWCVPCVVDSSYASRSKRLCLQRSDRSRVGSRRWRE